MDNNNGYSEGRNYYDTNIVYPDNGNICILNRDGSCRVRFITPTLYACILL